MTKPKIIGVISREISKQPLPWQTAGGHDLPRV